MAAPERRRIRPPEVYWPVTFALLLLLLVSCSALGPLLRGSGWWFAVAFVVAVVLCASAVLRRFRVAPSFVPVAALGVLLALVTLLFGNGSGLLWLVPTPATFSRFASLIDGGIGSIQQQSTPAEATEGIVFLVVVGAGLIAVLMDILAITLRWPALAGAPALIPLTIPGVVVDGGADAIALMLAAAAFLVLLRVDVRVRRAQEADNPDPGRDAPRTFGPVRRRGPGPLWGSLIVGGIGIVSALVLSTATPSLTEGGPVGSGANGLLFGAGVSPMVDLGQDLRRPQPGPALHYTTSAVELPYFKILTLDQFVGTTWTAGLGRTSPGNTVDSIEKPPGLSDRVPATQTSTSIVIDGVETSWLPAPSPATQVVGLDGTWLWDSRTRSIQSTDATTRGQSYTVTALRLAPTAEQLRASSTSYPVSVAPYLDLPFPRPDIIDQTARAVTTDATSTYDAAVALQDYLRGNDFRYDTESPVQEGYDGGGVDVIGTFLEVRRGYCVHFASAMAIMARSLGIPSRIALGYLPGSKSSNTADGLGRYDVSSHDLHAWPELYFTGIGWVPFEPTPGRGTVPDYATPAAAQGAPATPGATLPTSTPRPRAGLEPDSGSVPGAVGQAKQANPLPYAGLILALVVCLLLAPGTIRRIRRLRRLQRVGSDADGAALAWAELADTALDYGVVVRDTETPRELAGRLAAVLAAAAPVAGPADAARAALDHLLIAQERLSYDRPGAGVTAAAGLPGDLATVIRALHVSAGRRARWRARALPASLWPAVLGWRDEPPLVDA